MLDVKYYLPSFNGKHSMKPFLIFLKHPTYVGLSLWYRQKREKDIVTSADKSLPVKPNLDNFLNLETIGISDSPVDPQDTEALKVFHETLQYEEGRYHVSWPWKNEITSLPENKELAFGRMKSLVRKMKNNCDLARQYDSILQDQLHVGVFEKVKPEPTDGIRHYIPHHAVVNLSKPTTKVRVVYDASVKTKPENKSLNERLYRGAVMLQDLTGSFCGPG